MNEIKIIANYLPQYHITDENSKWWGEGFTDWVATKKATPLFKNHKEPRIPLNNNYYSLDNVDAIRWQAKLARKYGVYGFGIYHYWFSSKQILLKKPAEILLENKDIDINFLFLWDNGSWKRTWSKARMSNDWAPKYEPKKVSDNVRDDGILAELIYGDKKEWYKHFMYLLPFFRDSRYIKIDNKPLFAFFQPHNRFDIIKEIVIYWDELAKNHGFNGIICMNKENYTKERMKYQLRYTPLSYEKIIKKIKYKLYDEICLKLNKLRIYDYDKVWKEIIYSAQDTDKYTFLSGFVDYDDTPRRGRRGAIFKGSSPEKFGRYIEKLAQIAKDKGQEYLFVTAWNEWAEGAYLEPDTVNGYAYLEQLKMAIEKVNKS